MVNERLTRQQNIDLVNAYKIYDIWYEVFRRLYPDQLYRNKNTLAVREDIYYLNIDVFQYVNGQEVFTAKFPYSLFVDEITQYKNYLIDEINLFFDAKEIRDDLSQRLSVLDVAVLALRLGYPQANPAIFVRDILENGSVSIVENLEAENIDYQIELDAMLQEELSIKNGISKIRHGEEILAMMITRNEAKGLTPEQFNQFVLDQDITLIERFLKNGSLITARYLVSIKVVDDVIFLQSDKDFVLSKLNERIALYANGN